MTAELRRRDRALGLEAASRILEKGAYCVISVMDSAGEPYGVPVSYVASGNALYFHCAQNGRKIDCFKGNPLVSVCAVSYADPLVVKGDFTVSYESVIAQGHIHLVTGEEERHQALVDLCMKYSPEHASEIGTCIHRSSSRTLIYRIDLEQVSAKGAHVR